MTRRRTIASPARVSGISLFRGCDSTVSMEPAAAGDGVRFEYGGQAARAETKCLSLDVVHPAFAAMPARSTNLRLGEGAVVYTVEHLLSVVAALGVTDLVVRLDCAELPIGDGSGLLFLEAIDRAGLMELESDVRGCTLRDALRIGEPDGVRIEIEPAEMVLFEYHLDYGAGSLIPAQLAQWDGSADNFRTNVAPARTYCLKHEAELMRSLGLFGRLTPRDMLVIGESGPIDNALRFDNEPARHKLLDLIGDLALIGRPFPLMTVRAYGSGHALNHEAARALVARLDGAMS